MDEEEIKPEDEMIMVPIKEYEELLEAWNKIQKKKEYNRNKVEKYREIYNCSPSNDWQKKNREKVTEKRREYYRLRYIQKKEATKLNEILS
jgi:hypothetical protein